MKIISFANQKGGVGKSTLTFNISYLLADKKKKVLMIDFDPQQSLSVICGEENHIQYSIYDVLKDSVAIKDAIISITDNLDFIPANQDLANLDLEIVGLNNREAILKKALLTVKDLYDYVLIDCPPALNLLLVNALVASTNVIIPTETDYLSYKGLDLLLNTIAKIKDAVNRDLSLLGVVATFYDSRTLHSREILELLEELDLKVITTVSSSTVVKDATLASLPLHRYSKTNKIVKQYKSIMEAILNG